MAIAFDAAASGNLVTTGTATLSHTCTGANRILFVGTYSNSTTKTISGVTYNGVAMTLLGSALRPNTGGSLWYLIAPATGANNIVATISSSGTNWGICSASYTGASQTGVPDATDSPATVGNVVAGTNSSSFNTVADNSWIVGMSADSGPTSAGSGTTSRGTVQFGGFIGDTNAPIHPAGSGTFAWTGGVGGIESAVSFAPVAASATDEAYISKPVTPVRFYRGYDVTVIK